MSKYTSVGKLYKIRNNNKRELYPRCVVLSGPDKGLMFMAGRDHDLIIKDGMITANEAYISGNTTVGILK